MPTTPPPLHARRPRADERPTAVERGYDWTWAKTAKAWLREHPLCASCEAGGRTTPAVLVDHVRPITGGVNDPKRIDPMNLQSLCRRCHAAKTHGDRRAGLTR